MERHQKRERGQVLVILVVGVVALLGFAALAVDGGMFYAERRYDQNAADSAALTGAGAAGSYLSLNEMVDEDFECSHATVLAAIEAAETAAIQSAAQNQFNIDNDISDGMGVWVTCEDGEGTGGKHLDVHVQISTETKTSFAHFVFGGELENNVEAVAQIQPGLKAPLAGGMALVALNPACSQNPSCGDGQTKHGGITSCGNTSVTIATGSAWSNACIIMNGSGDVYINDGSHYISSYTKHGAAGSFVPTPQPETIGIALHVDPPECGDQEGVIETGEEGHGKNKVVYMETWPGNYPGGMRLQGNVEEIRMHPGLYCLGGDFWANNGRIYILGEESDGVTLYFLDGDFALAGNVEVNLRAPAEGSEGTPPALPGMLIFVAEGHDGEVSLRGNSNSSYQGTVYVPSGDVDLGGNSSSMGVYSTQIIADTIRVHGNPGMVINFDSGELYQDAQPSTMDLYK